MKNRRESSLSSDRYVRMALPVLLLVPVALFIKAIFNTALPSWGNNLVALVIGGVGGFALVLLVKVKLGKAAM